MAKKIIQVVYQVNDKDLIRTKADLDGIESEAKQADAAINKFGKDAQKAGKQGHDSFLSMKNVMDSIVALGITAYFASAAKAIFNLGVKQEQLNIAFGVFLGSATKAKQLISDLTQFAIVTPFTPDEVNGAAKALLAFGVAGEEIIPTLKFLGDVSAGTGKNLAEMAVIFGQIRSTGRLMGQDLLQLINAGFNPLQQISTKTGKSVGDLKKEMEKGLITFDMVKQAFIDATSAGGTFFNLMEKQSQSIGGKLSTITGNIEEVAKGIFENNIELLQTFIDKLGIATDVLLKWVKTANSDPNFDIAAKNAESYRKALEDAFKEFESGKGPEAINKALSENVKFTNEWEESVDMLAKKVRETTGDEFEKYNNQLQQEQQTVKLLTLLTQEYIKKVRDVSTTTGEEILTLDKLKKKVDDLNKQYNSDTSRTDIKKLASIKKQIDQTNVLIETIKEMSSQTPPNESDLGEVFVPEFNQSQFDFSDLEKERKEANDREFKENEEHNNKLIAQQEAYLDRIKELKVQAFNFGVDLVGQLLLANQSSLKAQIEAEEATTDESIALAGDDTKRKEELRLNSSRRIRELRKQEAEEEKQQTIKKILIEGALNAVKALGLPPIPGANFIASGLALGMAVAHAAVVRAVGFKDGVIDLQGPGTGRSDSIRANLSAGESVITAEATSHSKNLLQAIQDRKIDDRILSKLKVGANGIIANLNDKNIVKAIQDNRAPSLTKEGYALYETIEGANGFKRRIRSKQINS